MMAIETNSVSSSFHNSTAGGDFFNKKVESKDSLWKPAPIYGVNNN